MARPRRNALVLVSDEKIFPAAVFNAVRLAQLNQRSDTDVILFSDWTQGISAAKPTYPRVDFRQVPTSLPRGCRRLSGCRSPPTSG
jgi:hypothetical protein